MLISEEWLRQWVNPKQDLQQIAYDLTQAGLEVESITQAASECLEQVIVAEILAAGKHPNAERLKLCQVTDGRDEYEIVCGAPNARQGIKVALARIGTTLPGNFKIKKSKIRGSVSEGMLCSAYELEISDDHEGIIELPATAKLGEPLSKHIPTRPPVMDLAITPNRGDCLSHQGVARDLAALYDCQLNKPDIKPVKPQHTEELPIELADPEGCPRYLGRIIKGIDINKPALKWMKQRLIAVGLNPINIAVDVTNYVMYELGQPLHAFDLRQLEGGIIVRGAKKNEQLTMLDGRVLKLDEEDLLIADHKKALALAGVMGGKHSGIADDTVDVFLEVAYFSSPRVFGKQQKYTLVTDAAYRYERHVDPDLCFEAIERATSLLIEVAGGSPGPVTEGVNQKYLPQPRTIEISHHRVADFLGFDKQAGYYIDEKGCEKILNNLGMQVTSMKAARKVGQASKDATTDDKTWQVTIPGYRADIDCPESLYEELARVYGYDKLPSTIPVGASAPLLANQEIHQEDRIRELLAARGFNEVINYAFISKEEVSRFYPGMKKDVLPLANPISADKGIMRPGLLVGLLGSVVYNHQQNRIDDCLKLFELGHCFASDKKTGEVIEHNYLGLAIVQLKQDRNRTHDHGHTWLSEPYSLALLQAEIKALVSRLKLEDRLELIYGYKEDGRELLFHPKQQFALKIRAGKGDDAIIGAGGALHPEHASEYKIKGYSAYFFSCNLDQLPHIDRLDYKGISRLPASYLELSLEVASRIPYSELEGLVRQTAGAKLSRVKLLDIYQSDELERKGIKSVSLKLTWQADDKTLTDEQVNQFAAAMLKQLAKHNIKLRDG